jgi:hypothetical protein
MEMAAKFMGAECGNGGAEVNGRALSAFADAPALRLLRRLAVFLAVTFAVTALLKWSVDRADRDGTPAGFARGALHGAMMPLALPQLLMGRDVPIYSEKNTGRPYKLGYVTGVNVCGLVFFGILFWRVSRWRKDAGQPARLRAGDGG